MSISRVDLGDVPTWIGSIGALLAFMFALVIFQMSVNDRRREQARRVSAWAPGGVSRYPVGFRPGDGSIMFAEPRIGILLHITNNSDELIGDVHARFVQKDGTAVDALEPVRWTDIGPGQPIEIQSFAKDPGTVGGELRIRLDFTDAAGRRWTRLGGELRRADHSGAKAFGRRS